MRSEAIQYAFKARLPNGKPIVPLIENLLIIAQKGLIRRKKNEELFLNPLFERLKNKVAPADKAIKIFKQKGLKGLLDTMSFNATTLSNSSNKSIQTSISTSFND